MSSILELKEKVKHLKVLFVDDENDIRKGTSIFLRKFFDDVVVSSDGIEGLNAFTEESNFDIVITDVLMPNMNGIEMIKEIKKIDKNNVFVIFLTASRGLKDLDKNLSNITLQKPLSFEDMTYIMQQLSEI
ncbi:MAG: response regulator [Campylobacterota bacterium]|nr:response regulator [Campylobacterota bacterium]